MKTMHTFMHTLRISKLSRGGKPYKKGGFKKSTQTGIRTQDQLVKSQLLYQLSYLRI